MAVQTGRIDSWQLMSTRSSLSRKKDATVSKYTSLIFLNKFNGTVIGIRFFASKSCTELFRKLCKTILSDLFWQNRHSGCVNADLLCILSLVIVTGLGYIFDYGFTGSDLSVMPSHYDDVALEVVGVDLIVTLFDFFRDGSNLKSLLRNDQSLLCHLEPISGE